MFPIVFQLGPITVYSFGVMMALGFFFGTTVAVKEYQRRVGEDPAAAETPQGDAVWNLLVWVFLAGLAGARVLSLLNDPAAFIADPAQVFASAGFVWYGGLIGGAAAAVILTRRRKLPLLDVVESTSLGLALGQALGRIGCHVSGDGDWGRVTDLPWGVAYTNGVVAWPHPPGIFVHPTPLYEFICYFAIFMFLWKYRHRNPPVGTLFSIYAIGNGTARFFIEFLRIEPRVALGLTQAQWVAMGLVAFGVWWLARIRSQRPAAGRAVA